MSVEAQRIYLSNKFTAGMLAGGVTLPVKMPNVPFDIPVNAPYGEFHIITGPVPVTIAGEGRGKVRNRHTGMVQLTIWMPEDSGTKVGTRTGDKFKDIFQLKLGRDSSQDVYQFGVLQSFTPDTKTGYSVAVFRVPFTRDEVAAVQISI